MLVRPRIETLHPEMIDGDSHVCRTWRHSSPSSPRRRHGGDSPHVTTRSARVTTSVRRSVRYLAGLLSSVALLAPSMGRAQSGQIELRLDAVRVQSFSESLSLSVAAPGNAAVAYYFTPALAIDARFVGLAYASTELPDGTTRSSTSAQFAAFLPYHFGGTRGRSGFFVAPGLTYSTSSASGGSVANSSNSFFTWGAELGFKKAIRGNVSLRAAATYEDGDRPETIGATGGISVFFR